MTKRFDCIVLGVGGFGSGTLYHLAKRGVRVLGLEQFGVPHDRGSSHGETRIIRKAYFEHPDYVPLLLRAYELWDELETESGRELCRLCGLFLAGPADGAAVAGARESARLYGVGLEDVALAEARRRYPGFRFADEVDVVFEPEAGYLDVERCVQAHVDRAVASGAELRANETVQQWSSDGKAVRVRTDRDEYEAASLVVTAGAWTGRMLGDLSVPLEVVRKPVCWCRVQGRDYDVAGGTPAYYFETPKGDFYGFPCIDGETIKVAQHSGGERVADPSNLDRDIHESDLRPMREFLQAAIPGVDRQPARHSVCMYTHTPDHHFIVDVHPELRNVAIGAGFSGHGFKFTGVLGQALAELAIDGRTDLPMGFLSLNRASLAE